MYGEISPSHINDFEREVTEMHYDTVTPVDKNFNKVEDLIEYCYMACCPYSHPQVISKAYNILNKTGKFRESIKSWNCLPPIQKKWIAFKINFREAHQELAETG